MKKEKFLEKLTVKGQVFDFYAIEKVTKAFGADINKLPYSLRVLLESSARNFDGKDFNEQVLEKIATWVTKRATSEIPFKPSRVVLQDFTGVPAIVDLASMRAKMIALGKNGEAINPEVPVDLVIDHSVQVDEYGCAQALSINVEKEFERNQERYAFLKWAQTAFKNLRVVPPSTGIIHQVNLEYLTKVVDARGGVLFPDTLVGTDSHTTMINGIGVLGWGVGGIEAEAGMLGEPSFFPLPEVIGVKFTNKLRPEMTATDLALKVTETLRRENVVGKFVEYFGESLKELSLADRATIANMAPEYGATCGFFPIDDETLNYMKLSNRSEEEIARVESYAKTNHLFYDAKQEPTYSKVIEIDLSKVETLLSGPKRPQDTIVFSQMRQTFETALSAPLGNLGFGLSEEESEKVVNFALSGREIAMQTGDIAIAAITSCTNTSNPSVMIAAGLVAKKAVELGLRVPEFVKTSLAPGSKVVTGYLEKSGLLSYMAQLGFDVVGYGCTTCIGNSGPMKPEIEHAIRENDLLVTSVLSGNRNFEGRIHPLVKGNYLASPPLVVLYALLGSVRKDVEGVLFTTGSGKEIFAKDLLPTHDEIKEYVDKFVTKEIFETNYAEVFSANTWWNEIKTSTELDYKWDTDSTYIQNPPFFDTQKTTALKNLRTLAKLGDSVTTDHISPAGNIAMKSPAGEFLASHGVAPADFNSYGSRRGNHEIMMRGTFANIRIRNALSSKEGGFTTYFPTNEEMTIFDASQKYQADGTGLVVIAGRDYGMGSSRDWAAKGTSLLGVKAVLAKSYERIHRSNLVMMGVLPLEFLDGADSETLGLTGRESFTIDLPEEVAIHEIVQVHATNEQGVTQTFQAKVRFDSLADIDYYKHQGILPMVLTKKVFED